MERPPAPRRTSPGAIVGIVLVSIWMAVSLLVAFILGFGDIYVCDFDAPPGCSDRYGAWWLGLMAFTAASAIAAIVLWVRPGTRLWGFVVGLLGTGGAVIAFTLAYDVPL